MKASRHRGNSFYSTESKKEKVEFKKNVKFSKNRTKKPMSTSTSQLIWIMGKPKPDDKKSMLFKDVTKKHSTLKELQEKKCPFSNLDLSGMPDDLLKKGVIELPEPKCPEEAGRTPDPIYYRYYRVISHPQEKRITLKERIMWLAKDGRIILYFDETTEANHVTVQEVDESHFEVNLTEAPKVLGEYFPKSFFDCVAVYMTSCSESDDDETNGELSVPPKRDWHERLGEAIWAYRTTYRMPILSTPYALVYEVEVVLPLVIQIPSLRVAIQGGLSQDENYQLHLAELEALHEKDS